MNVCVESEADFGMSEPLGDNLGMHSGFEHVGGVRVPKIVQTAMDAEPSRVEGEHPGEMRG